MLWVSAGRPHKTPLEMMGDRPDGSGHRRRLGFLRSALQQPPAQRQQGAAAAEPEPTPPATHQHVPRFSLSQPGQGEAMLSFLEEQGFAVVESALSAEEAAHALTLTWDYLESGGTGIDRADPSTWAEGQWPFGAIGGNAGIGHSEQLWYIRGCPGVKQAWATIYGTEDLITSYDGMSLFRPWTVEPSWRTDGPWYHTDQSPFPPPDHTTDPAFDPEAAVYGSERHYVQGFVNLLENTPLTGGNVVIPGSHRMFVEMLEQGVPRTEFMDKLLSRDALAQGIVAHLQPGDLFLWDSRATHGATPGNLTAATSGAGGGAELFRAAAYVCMAPTSRASERVLQQREEMLLAHQGTGAFCAAYNNNAAGGRPRDSGSAFQPVLQDMDQLSPSQWELVIGKARAAARFTTNATDKAEAAAMRVGGGAAADIAVPSVLDAVASVKIDADAIQKYVLIKATTESESISTSTYVVRGSEAAKYHRNAAQETLVELENLGVRYEVLGGGRIKHDTATRTIEIFGYSNGFPWVGEPRHDLSAEAVRAAFPGFEVTTSNGGY